MGTPAGLPLKSNQSDDSESVLRADDEDLGVRGLDSLPTVLKFHDGMLEKDVSPPFEDDTTPFTLIKVRYLPDQEIPPKCSINDVDDDSHGRRRYKRRKQELPDDYTRRRGKDTPFQPTSAETLLESKDFARDVSAIIKLKQASLALLKHWEHNDLIAFALDQGFDAEGSRDTLIHRVGDWKQKEIEALRSEMSNPNRPQQSKSGEGISTLDVSDPENWPLDELQVFCLQNDLSEVGTRNALVIKVKKYMKEQGRGGKPNIKRSQRERTDIYGRECYIFGAVLSQSSVAALKSALSIAGNFPPGRVMTLFFKDTPQEYLQDDKPLNFYKHRDWTTVLLKTITKWGNGKANTHDVDAESKLRLDNATQRIEALKAILSDPSVQRAADVLLNGARPTLGELVEQVGDRAKRLDRMVQAGGHLGRVGREPPRAATSGLGILGEVEDYEDDEENKKRGLEKLLRGELEEDGRDDEDYPPPGISHMADLFHAIRKKGSP